MAGTAVASVPLLRGKERTQAVLLWDRPGDFPSPTQISSLRGFCDIMSSFGIV